MKISKILELLIILLIIAFAASKPFHKHHGKISRQNPNTDAETETYDENDEDDDDFFGLDAEDLDDDDEDKIGNSTIVQDQDNLDDSDGFLLFGDDFLAVFDDDENETKPTKNQKNKIQTAAAAVEISQITLPTNADSINTNSQLIPIETVQTVVNQLTQKNDGLMTNNDKQSSGSQLNLQHTSALLELVQNSNAAMNHNLTEDNNLKLEGTDNFLNSTLNDGEETPTLEDNSAVIAQPLSDIEQEMLQETLNKVKQQQQLLISTTTTAVPNKKVSTTSKPSTGFLGIVEDLIEDDDEEEAPEDDDDDDEDDDEEEKPAENENEDDDDDEEDSEEIIKKPTKSTTTTTTVKPSKTKRPTNFIDVIGDTLGL